MYLHDFQPGMSPPAPASAKRPTVELSPGLDFPGFVMSFEANEEIFAEEESVDFVYRVVDGAVRSTRFLADGRRQIDAFHLAGDVFGLESSATHRFTTEAVDACRIALVRRNLVEQAAARDIAVARRLWALTSRDLEHLQDHMMLLSRKNAAERVGAFLLDLRRRTGSSELALPMSRGDIADHVGLTLETVSRTLSQFARAKAIDLPSPRRIVIRTPGALTVD